MSLSPDPYPALDPAENSGPRPSSASQGALLPAAGLDFLKAELIEQLMRCTDDETLVLPFVSMPLDAALLRSLLGERLPELPVGLHPGTPVLALLGYSPLDPAWRDQVPPLPVSLWSELCFLRELSRTSPAAEPLTELLAARL